LFNRCFEGNFFKNVPNIPRHLHSGVFKSSMVGCVGKLLVNVNTKKMAHATITSPVGEPPWIPERGGEQSLAKLFGRLLHGDKRRNGYNCIENGLS
jgi:hypothetical protein